MGGCLVEWMAHTEDPYDGWFVVRVQDGAVVQVSPILVNNSDWQHQMCSDPISSEAFTLYWGALDVEPRWPVNGTMTLRGVEPVDPATILTTTQQTEDVPIPVVSGDQGGGGLPWFPLLLVATAGFTGFMLWRRRSNDAPRISKVQKWMADVRIDGFVKGNEATYAKRRTFNEAERKIGLKRAGGRCEWVEHDGTRCEVLHGINGMQLAGDHLFPWSQGGTTHLRNFGALCPRHNTLKSDRIMDDEWYQTVLNNRKLVRLPARFIRTTKSEPNRPPLRIVPTNGPDVWEGAA
jgi:hypothetical protein